MENAGTVFLPSEVLYKKPALSAGRKGYIYRLTRVQAEA